MRNNRKISREPPNIKKLKNTLLNHLSVKEEKGKLENILNRMKMKTQLIKISERGVQRVGITKGYPLYGL